MNMDLPADSEMARLAPFPGIDPRQTATGVQQVVFKLGQDTAKTNQRNYFQVDYEPFSHDRVRQVVLNQMEQWILSTVGDPDGVPSPIPPVPHIFHIHVNPFQVARKGPGGGYQLVWKDTILVPASGDAANPASPVNIWTKYTDYIGGFVLHCHILDHEDLGMMEVVEVSAPRRRVKPCMRSTRMHMPSEAMPALINRPWSLTQHSCGRFDRG